MVDVSGAPVAFQDAITFFANKVRLPTQAWTDLWQEQHNKAFVVAGATETALLEDFQNAIAKALNEGTTLEAFRADFDEIVAKHGWSYKGRRGWRTKVIYETNLRTSYAAGRWAQIEKAKRLRPYLRYVAVDDERTRRSHKSLNDLVYEVDHAFWDTHYPPNGWGCRCSVQSLSKRDLDRLDLTPSTALPPGRDTHTITVGGRDTQITTPHGIEPGFAYNPGRNRLTSAPTPPSPGGIAPGDGARATDALPPPRRFNTARLLPEDGLEPEDYANEFLKEFGASVESPTVFIDKSGEALPISADLFRSITGEWKINKSGRQRFLRLLADSIKDPDEIWYDWHYEKDGPWRLRRRYIARFELSSNDGRESGLAVFEVTRDGWREITLFAPKTGKSAAVQDTYLQNQRRGLRVYRRQ